MKLEKMPFLSNFALHSKEIKKNIHIYTTDIFIREKRMPHE